MIKNLEHIEYRCDILEKGMKPNDLSVEVWRGSKIPTDVLVAINAENMFNLGGVYGDQKADEPVEYDNLMLTLSDDAVEITVFNRGIMPNDERIRRIRRVLV
jgi:hypothetical protein